LSTEGRADSRRRRRALPVAALAATTLAVLGCLPGGDQGKSDKRDASFGFAQREDSGGNSSAKRDPLLEDIADAAQKLFDSPASTASRKSGREAAVYAAAPANDAAAGTSGAPLVEDIPEIPANVALSTGRLPAPLVIA